MTKEITKANILQELQDKFALRELAPEKFRFSEEVVPVYNIEQHLTRTEIKSTIVNVSSGPLGYIFFYIPGFEKWHLHRYNVVFQTGVYTIAGVMIYRPALAEYFYLDLAAAQNTSYAHDLPKDVILSPNDRIAIYVDGYTSTGNLELRIDVTVENVR